MLRARPAWRTRDLHGTETRVRPAADPERPHPAAQRCCVGGAGGAVSGEPGASSCFILFFFNCTVKGRSECATSEAIPLWPLIFQNHFCLESSSLPRGGQLLLRPDCGAWALRMLPSGKFLRNARSAPPREAHTLPGRAPAGGRLSLSQPQGPRDWPGRREACLPGGRERNLLVFK